MKKQRFNQQWTLRHGTSSVMKSLMMEVEAPETVDLPHDAMIAMSRSADAPSGPGMAYFHGKELEYARTFFVSREERERAARQEELLYRLAQTVLFAERG